MSAREQLIHWALGPVSSLRLGAFRWAATFALFVYTLAWSMDASEWLTAAGYHLSPEASWGLQLPVPLLGGAGLWLFLALYIGAMVMILVGIRARAASVVVLIGLLYVTTADRLAAFSMNKLALVAFLILVLAPWPTPSDPSDHSEGASEPVLRSAWPLRVLQGTLLLQYLGAGVCKIRGGWLGDSRVLWHQAQGIYMTDLCAWMVREFPLWMWAGLQHMALGFELLAPLLFCARKLVPVAFVWGVLMHLGIALMMYRVGYFSLSVLAYYLLFADERWLRALHARLAG